MKKGFTLIELMLSMAIAASMFGLIMFNVLGALRTTSVTTTMETLNADIKKQQMKAMNTAMSYGVRLEPNKYILFPGTSFDPTNPENVTISVDNTIQVSSTFPNNMLIFSQLSGEIIAFVDPQNTILIKNTAGTEQKQITLNKYGIVTQIQ